MSEHDNEIPAAKLHASHPDSDEQLDYQEVNSVRAIHAAIVREQAEPQDGHEPVSLWLLAVFFATLLAGGYYLGAYSGRFDSTVFDERVGGGPIAAKSKGGDQVTVAQGDKPDIGKRIYRQCAACHQASGVGQAGLYPSLVGSKIANGGGGRAVRMVLYGAQGPWQAASGNVNGVMTPFGPLLKDDEIAAVLTYVRSSWGSTAGPITKEQVAAVREATKGRTASWTFDELMAQPDDLPAAAAAPAPEAPAAPATGGAPAATPPAAPPA
jgi:mono/diheme cytochrome c family protein